ncbi:MAG TPA: STAS domain-containing protein [Anaerolineales bacterium]
MEIKVSTDNGRVPVTVVHVDGNIDSASYQTFQSRVEKLIKDGTQYILIDLTHAPYVSSAGFRALHQIFNRLRSVHPDSNLSEEAVKKGISAGTYKSPHLKLLNLSKETKTSFDMSGFDMFIETYDDRKKAIASF